MLAHVAQPRDRVRAILCTGLDRGPVIRSRLNRGPVRGASSIRDGGGRHVWYLDDVLQSEEDRLGKFSTSAFEVGVDMGGTQWVLLVVRDLSNGTSVETGAN